jgi:hypothetical protein
VFVGHDTVEAVGAAREFAAMFAEAKTAGQEKEFIEGFEGRPLGKKPKRKTLGKHTAKEEQTPEKGRLF